MMKPHIDLIKLEKEGEKFYLGDGLPYTECAQISCRECDVPYNAELWGNIDVVFVDRSQYRRIIELAEYLQRPKQRDEQEYEVDDSEKKHRGLRSVSCRRPYRGLTRRWCSK